MLFKTIVAFMAIFFMTAGGYFYRRDEENVAALATIVSGFTLLLVMQW